jgi:hypothetical protein
VIDGELLKSVSTAGQTGGSRHGSKENKSELAGVARDHGGGRRKKAS